MRRRLYHVSIGDIQVSQLASNCSELLLSKGAANEPMTQPKHLPIPLTFVLILSLLCPSYRRMHTPPVLEIQATMSDINNNNNNVTVLDSADPLDQDMDATLPYPVSFQVSLTGFLMLEIVLGLSSNLTVLVLYCMKSNLVSSVSNIVTMNLHVLDVLVCVACIPLTIAVVLLPPQDNAALVCCFHEASVSFASVATAANVLAITLDRYDISVRPANRVLTMGRAVALLGSIWVLSFLSFLVPFMEVGFFIRGRVLILCAHAPFGKKVIGDTSLHPSFFTCPSICSPSPPIFHPLPGGYDGHWPSARPGY